MRSALERLRAIFGGLGSDKAPEHRGGGREDSDEHPRLGDRGALILDVPRDELPAEAADSGLLQRADWVSSQPRIPREPPRIIANIRAKPKTALGPLERPAALGTLLEGALAFALDDAIDDKCESIEIRLLSGGAAVIEHAGPGYDPQRCMRGCQRWPWLRRSPEGEIMLTRTLAAPVVTCALSHWLRVEISRADGLWRGAFYRGQLECALNREPPRRGGVTYTRVSFRPDPELFHDLEFSIDDLYLRGLGLLLDLSGVELRIYDERSKVPPLVVFGTGPSL